MGRYYSGSIRGKFWFGLQSSSAADRFGVFGSYLDDNSLEYHFKENHLGKVNDEIKMIETHLGEKKKTLDVFFENNMLYNSDDILKLGVTNDEFKEYVNTILKQQHPDDFDADKAKEIADGLLSKKKGNDYGPLIGMLNKS
jgi:hypothetical protein